MIASETDRKVQEKRGSGNGLRRRIGTFALYAFIVGDTLGAGIYALVGQVGERAGGAVWIPMALSLAFAVLTASSYAELVSKFPSSAGVALFVDKAFGRPWLTFVVGFALVSSTLASAASLATAFAGDYLRPLVDLPSALVIPLFLGLIALIILRGVTHSMRANIVMTAIEALGLGIVIVLAVMMVSRGEAHLGQLTALHTDRPTALVVLSSAALAMFAFMGFEGSASMADEVADVRRAYPRALLGAIITSGAMYLMLGVAVTVALPVERMGGSSGPLLKILAASGAGIPPAVFSVIALVAVSNGALLSALMSSRLLFGMSAQGWLPPQLSQWRTRGGSPWAAVALSTLATWALTATGSLEALAEVVVLVVLLVFFCVNLCVILLRKVRVEGQAYWAPRWAAYAALALSAVFLVQQSPGAWARGGILMAVGLAGYGAMALRARRA